MKSLLVIVTIVAATSLWAGPYSGGIGGGSAIDEPVPGFVGPNGDGIVAGNTLNPIFKGWATSVVDYSPANPEMIDAQWKNTDAVLGPVTGDNFDVASLGELTQSQISSSVAPGSITVGFDLKIVNGEGYDFVIFENGFAKSYGGQDLVFMELAYVEVSTDGINFVRFPSVSLNPEQPQDYDDLSWDGNHNTAMAYGSRDPTNVHNLAGKHVNDGGESWGTGFDLSDLINETLVQEGLVDLNDINYIRIVDIPGTGECLDSEGNPIYDPWQTYGSGGFDLEAVGVINGIAIPEPSAMCAVLLLGAFVVMARSRR